MEQVEKVTVVPAELIAVKKGVLSSIAKAIEATNKFFGGGNSGEEAIESVELIEASPAHALILSAKTELQLADDMKITTADEYTKAADDLQRIKGIAKEVEAKRKEITAPIDESKKQVQDLFRPAGDFCIRAETAIKKAMIAFDAEQQRLARIAEQQRREKEERERAALEAEQSAARAKAAAEEKRLRDAAAEAAAAGDTVAAAKLETKADAQQDIGEARVNVLEAKAAEVQVAAPIAPVAVKGISKRVKYVATVTDMKALVAAVAAGTVPLNVLKADESALTKMANALSGELAYPGVSVSEETIIGARSK